MFRNDLVPRRGFTLIELIVAMTLSAVVLLGARALWESLAGSVDRLRAQATLDARATNGERLLRSLVGRLQIGPDRTHDFVGDRHAVYFTTWCDRPAGWQELCGVVLDIEPDTTGGSRLVARLATGDTVTLQRGFATGALRYLTDPASGGRWSQMWSRGFDAPIAIGVITDGDTTIVYIGPRG